MVPRQEAIGRIAAAVFVASALFPAPVSAAPEQSPPAAPSAAILHPESQTMPEVIIVNGIEMTFTAPAEVSIGSQIAYTVTLNNTNLQPTSSSLVFSFPDDLYPDVLTWKSNCGCWSVVPDWNYISHQLSISIGQLCPNTPMTFTEKATPQHTGQFQLPLTLNGIDTAVVATNVTIGSHRVYLPYLGR